MKQLKYFNSDIDTIPVPKQIDYPFYYTPHKLAQIAANDLQQYLIKMDPTLHNFGLAESNELAIGKMFGVLVVETAEKKLAQLWAYSGKLIGGQDLQDFVPFVYLESEYLKKKETTKIAVDELNKEIDAAENNPKYISVLNQFEELKATQEQELKEFRSLMIEKKALRKIQRERLLDRKDPENLIQLEKLNKESIALKKELKLLIHQHNHMLEMMQKEIDHYQIKALKVKRKSILADLQKFSIEQYEFLNYEGQSSKLSTLFKEYSSIMPPAGSGDCAAPKLFQFAYKNNLKPIALAEFWWGAPHKSQIREHKKFYPACKSRCYPILSHMLKGLNIGKNPMIAGYKGNFEIEYIYEDEDLIVINKPHGLLSVPGKELKDSVQSRINPNNKDYPKVIHRLDQETSGLMLIAKNYETYKFIQKQFIDKTVQKKYIAVLSKDILSSQGVIDLPLATDFINRPAQMVCFNNGKASKTIYKVIEINQGKTRIEFTPKTGRTHQLRVHSAHYKGLNAPIVGDTIYGTPKDRLHLHAQEISFIHPKSGEEISFNAPAPF